ncbi:TRAP transporter large permease [Aquibium microcysteis]|uniref:TRAP transporter large permease n=1 Tax=Aquibium microcysteis TaxID=675281 RepID=UPI00165D1386|nr:TRAP transporter large permease [Aquibium microcysteis]
MTDTLIAIGGFVGLFVLIILRVPIGFAMGIAGVAGFAAVSGWKPGLNLLMNSPLRTASDYTLSVIPMFVLMGVFASASGMSRELFRANRAWFGHLRGGTAISTILACGGFAAINGSSVATAATMTTVALPEMRKAGMEPGLAAGTIAAGGTLGIMIPPSVTMLIYGILTEQDIAKLFMAGVIPGLLGILLYIAVVRIIVARRPELCPVGERMGRRERWSSLRDIWATLLLFAVIIGSIYGGFVTVTEAAGIGATGAFAIGVLRGRLNAALVVECLVEALRTTASIFVIAIGAYLFGYFLTVTQTAQALAEMLVELPIGPYGTLAIILLVYILLGAVMDELAIILLTVPIIFPVIVALGFDPIWFGVIIVMTVTLGLITPPVGMNVFVINSIARDVSLTTIFRGVAPFIAVDILRLVVLCAVPWLSLVIPNSMN